MLPAPASLSEINTALVGFEVERDPWIDSQSQKRERREQSENIVERMERVGIPGRSGRAVWLVGMVSEQTEQLPDFRNCNLIPTVQSRNTRGMHRHLEYFLSTFRKKSHVRMLVVSGGWVPLDAYRADHQSHCRRMSKFAAHAKLKRWGIRPFFYNVENTLQRDDDGRAMVNLHSHMLIHTSRFLGKRQWAEFLEFARAYFPKGYVHDSPLEKAAEAVKYCFKPSEFDGLTDPEFRWLAMQVIGGELLNPETREIETCGPLKFFHPLGAFREFRSELGNRKLIKLPKGDRWEWRLHDREKPEPEREGGGQTENVVLAVTRPLPSFSTRMEPCLLVEGYSGDFAAMVRQNRLQDFVGHARALYAERVRGEAASIKDTTTPTVPAAPPIEPQPHPPPDRLSPAIH